MTTSRRRFALRGVAAGTLIALLAGGPASAAAASAATTVGAEPPPAATDPGDEPWVPVPRDEVAEVCGLDPDRLEEASTLLVNTPFVIVRFGRLCWTGGYPTGYDQPYSVWSITKTLGALLFGMVASRSSLDDTDPVTEWIPPDVIEEKGINPEATLAHVLSMTSTSPDMRPGHREPWSYDITGDREINTLVGVMDRAIAQEPEHFPGVTNAREFAIAELFEPLGMEDSSWPGQVIGYSMISSQEDLARLGLLLLRRGRWQGQQLLDERYVYRMTHPAFEDVNTGYGYLTYVNAAENVTYSSGTPDDECAPYTAWPSYPHAPFFAWDDDNGGNPFDSSADVGLAWAAGAGGQKTSVHRGLDLVISVRDDVDNEGHKDVWNAIRPALVELDPTFAGDEEAFCDAYRRGAYTPTLLDPWSASATGPAALAGEEPNAADPSPDGAEAGSGGAGPLPATGAPVLAQVGAILTLLAGAAMTRRRR